MFELRTYQKQAMNDFEDWWQSDKKTGIHVLPTGAGKSIIIANMAMRAGRAVVMQPSKELLNQNYDKYIAYGFKAARFSASVGKRQIGPVTFAMPASVKKYVENFKEVSGAKLLIVDECHVGTDKGQMIESFAKDLGIKKILGLTATPVRMKSSLSYGTNTLMLNRVQDSLFNHISHVTQISDLVRDGYWAPVRYFNRPQPAGALMLNSSGTDYTNKSLNEYYMNNDIGDKIFLASDWALKTKGLRSVLVFVSLVEHAKLLERRIPGAKAIYGDMDAVLRDRYIKGFLSGEIKILLNVNVLGTGFDYPGLDCIIHARPTSSIAIWYQHIGRCVRPYPGKESLVVDLSGNYNTFGPIQDLVFMDHWNHKIGWGLFSGNRLLSGYRPGELGYYDKIIR